MTKMTCDFFPGVEVEPVEKKDAFEDFAERVVGIVYADEWDSMEHLVDIIASELRDEGWQPGPRACENAHDSRMRASGARINENHKPFGRDLSGRSYLVEPSEDDLR